MRARRSGKIINLIQLETLPATTEQKIREAIQTIGGEHVTIRRMLRGNVPDDPRDSRDARDSRDTLVLEGRVPNQIALVRVLTVAAQFFAGQASNNGQQLDIRVVADEAGALAEQQGQGQSPSRNRGVEAVAAAGAAPPRRCSAAPGEPGSRTRSGQISAGPRRSKRRAAGFSRSSK